MRHSKFTLEVDDETFKNIDNVELVIKHKNTDFVSKFPISKRMMKYKACLTYIFKVDKPSTGE